MVGCFLWRCCCLRVLALIPGVVGCGLGCRSGVCVGAMVSSLAGLFFSQTLSRHCRAGLSHIAAMRLERR